MPVPPAAPIAVRPARADEAPVLIAFNAAMARETEQLALDEAMLAAGVAAVLADPAKGRYFVAECDGHTAGQLLLTEEWSDWRNGRYYWIQSVYVAPEFRRRGVFTALYRHAEARARAPGAVGLRLYVHAHNERARAVYQRLGMVSHEYLVLETPDRLRADGTP